jgi:SAM-dependent methyltransferase
MREQAEMLVLRTADGRALPLQVSRWCGAPDAIDEGMLRHCRGPVLDVGCGPGRLTVALTKRGIPVLGVDISPAAVARVRQAGAPALHRSVFDPLPGQRRWATVLLADGNIGIGGRPARLLRRCADLLAPGGRILIEAEPGDIDEQLTAWLEHPDGRRGPDFPWARMGTAALLRAAADAGLQAGRQWHHADRAFVLATRPAARPERRKPADVLSLTCSVEGALNLPNESAYSPQAAAARPLPTPPARAYWRWRSAGRHHLGRGRLERQDLSFRRKR